MSEKTPLFSVIVPAYNVSVYIERCVKSVLEQTFCDFELILVDDGSTDDTLSKCKEFSKQDNRIKIIAKENGGHTSARNAGLEISCGKYILFLDSDDSIDIKTLEACQREISEHNSDIIIYGITKNDGINEVVLPNKVSDGFYSINNKDCDIINQALMTKNGDFAFPKSLSAKVFKRSIVYQNQMEIPQGVRLGEDGACFIASLLDANTISVISDVYYRSYICGNSVSQTGNCYAIREYHKLFEYYQNKILPKNEQLKTQFDLLVVLNLYTALKCAIMSNCDYKWIIKEWKNIYSYDYINKAIKNARFSKNARNCKIKHFIIKSRMFWLIKILMRKG